MKKQVLLLVGRLPYKNPNLSNRKDLVLAISALAVGPTAPASYELEIHQKEGE